MIIRAKSPETYTIVDNAIINERGLDWKELGLLVYLLSKPDDWQISVTHLANFRKMGKDGLYSILKKLRNMGYMYYSKNSDGTTDWVVSETPMNTTSDKDEPSKERPHKDEPHKEKKIQVSTERALSTERAINTEKNMSDNFQENEKSKGTDEKQQVLSKPAQENKTFQVFEFWKQKMGHPRAILDAKRKRVIQSALKTGYSANDLQQAILGCSKTPYNMGVNDQKQVYDNLSLILRDSEYIERFIGNTKPTNPNDGGGSSLPQRYHRK